jgi:predicted acyl esterase
VTSSSFPRWDRNLGTGRQDRMDRRSAEQTIYLDPERPSFIELPVVPPS